MDKRRIIIRVADTDTGLVVAEYAHDLDFKYKNNRNVLLKNIELYIDKLRNSSEYFSIEFACFKDPVREGVIPF